MNKLSAILFLALLWLACSDLSNPFDTRSPNHVSDSALVDYANHIRGRDTVITLDTFIVRDTLHDTVLRVDTTVFIDTVRLFDTTRVLDTTIIVDTTIFYDTLIHLDTIVSRDTLHFRDTVHVYDSIHVRDTLHFADTTVILDTTRYIDTVLYLDTLIHLDTMVFLDTITSTVYDTIRILDTISIYDTVRVHFQDTLYHLDTILVFDTIRIYDTVCVPVYDTIFIHDTIRHFDTTIIDDSLPYISTFSICSYPYIRDYGRQTTYICTLYRDTCCYDIHDTGQAELLFEFTGFIKGGSDTTDLRRYNKNPYNIAIDFDDDWSGCGDKYRFCSTASDKDSRTYIYYVRFFSPKYHVWTPHFKIVIVIKPGPKP